jgi:hypothetical protein
MRSVSSTAASTKATAVTSRLRTAAGQASQYQPLLAPPAQCSSPSSKLHFPQAHHNLLETTHRPSATQTRSSPALYTHSLRRHCHLQHRQWSYQAQSFPAPRDQAMRSCPPRLQAFPSTSPKCRDCLLRRVAHVAHHPDRCAPRSPHYDA